MNERICKAFARLNELKCEERDIISDLTSELTSFNGSIVEAIGLGLVKPVFAVSPGFIHRCKEKALTQPQGIPVKCK